MISAENNKRLVNGKWHCSRGVYEQEVFKCKFCGAYVTWFKSSTGKVYPINVFKVKDIWTANAFMGNHHNSTPCHFCVNREVKNAK